MRIQLLIVPFLYTSDVLALKGLKRSDSIRLLQGGPPVAGTPEEKSPTEPKEVAPKVGEPKKDPKGDAVSKDKKEKKCKKAKTASPPPPNNEPEERQLQNEAIDEPKMEVEYCLQGDPTEAECQAAMTGQLPEGHQRIQGELEIDISYNSSSSTNNLLNEVEQILKTETAAEFIGCDDKIRRHLEAAIGSDNNSTSSEEVRVTGVDFKNVKTIGQGNCISMSGDSTCDTISSNVEIHYTGEPVSTTDQEEMFAVLIATIKAQGATGDFSEIGTIENVELSSEISTVNGNGLNVAKTAGIPAGVVGAFLVIVGGIVIGYCMMRGNGDDEPNASNNVNTEQRGDVIEAEAIAVIDDDEKDSKWKFNPNFHVKRHRTNGRGGRSAGSPTL